MPPSPERVQPTADVDDVTDVTVRGTAMRLSTPTRALRLCARMNRELEVLDLVDSMSDGDQLWDVGACEGRFAVYAALQPGRRVVAVEPDPQNHAVLRRNIALNDLRGRITPVAAAVADHEGSGELLVGQPWEGGHHRVLATSGRTDLDEIVEVVERRSVTVTTLAALLDRFGAPTHLKVDVDGSEAATFAGAGPVLAADELRQVLVELALDDPATPDVAATLTSHGFEERARYEVEPGLDNVLFAR